MPTETPPHSKGLTPSWALSFYRRPKSPKRPSGSQSGGYLTPKSTSRCSGSEDSRSVHSVRSRGRSPFGDLINRLRSSSSVTLVEEPLILQESEFKQIETWFAGFDRYNQLVTHLSRNQSYPSDTFSRISGILSENCGGRFVHGLPEAVFDFSLLWCPAGNLTRKDSNEPTWSWTGWDGPVNFPFDPTNCPDLLGLPRSEGEWFRSEILQYHIGPQSAPYTVRREKKEQQLRIQYPPYFHAPWGYDTNPDSNTLRFSAYTIPADGFTAEQLHYRGKEIPCSHLINEKDQHCGVIIDFEEAISAPSSTGPFEFVLVSRNLRREPATQTRRPVIPTIHPPGTPIWYENHFVWDKEVMDYDEEVFENGPWKMLNVILIKWVGNYAERVAVARIHEDAWLKCSPNKQEITLK
ncbi:hypothetical protein K469DRAFT_690964 [Zopfia rhizophila CBS 207.26]|uniref:Heterokaryon incompatibility domain-containing protein n=1 Tax=Zopfia rhizophila CBS 207.26 TaxID=1314779 RepID=A0A6A6ETZ8_9PEZI|nr:hypothetical protein K469DRAFT_690964 [Zopfia rhizophila CBS 207.26]